MDYRDHEHRPVYLIHFVNNPIRKALRTAPTKVPLRMFTRGQIRVHRKFPPNLHKFVHQCPTQAGLPGFIPQGRIGDLIPYLVAEYYLPHRGPSLARRCDSTSSQLIPESGFLRYSASRSSTNRSSAGDKAESSSSTARWISNCRCSIVSLGSSAKTSLKLMPAPYPKAPPPQARVCPAAGPSSLGWVSFWPKLAAKLREPVAAPSLEPL